MYKQKLGGDRVGSGAGMEVEMPEYERANHDLSSTWKSPMAVGTITPCMGLVGMRGDTFDIEVTADVQTPATIGALFGSLKFQIDFYSAPWRLYMGLMHNNALGIGNDMSKVRIPQLIISATAQELRADRDYNISQINQSSIFAYFGKRGIGHAPSGVTGLITRHFNALKEIAYYDICKNYYWNKQEGLGAIIHNKANTFNSVKTSQVYINGAYAAFNLATGYTYQLNRDTKWRIVLTNAVDKTEPEDLYVTISGRVVQAIEVWKNVVIEKSSVTGEGDIITLQSMDRGYTNERLTGWRFATIADNVTSIPRIKTFPLTDIDKGRTELMNQPLGNTTFVNNFAFSPWKEIFEANTNQTAWSYQKTQEGLALGTYQSDKFNNWLSTATITGAGGVNELSRIVVKTDNVANQQYIEVDQINIATKVQKLLNAVAVSGGGFWDWMDAVYGRGNNNMVFSPVYHGGVSKEVVFQEVTTQSAAEGEPAGSIVGRGRFNGKNKGGKVTIRVDEPSYIIGLVKMTPRLDYSQGNRWDNNLKNVNELHKPVMDRIGFQDLLTDEMAWWDTEVNSVGVTTFKSAGKQPSWIQYMTDYNEVFGAFAEPNSQMYMTFNRRYEADNGMNIKDLTTIIDPSKYNYIFAMTSLDAMNYMVQIRKEVHARRKVSNKQMPQV